MLQIQGFGVLAVLLGLLGLLVIVFAPVDDTGHRRVGVGRNLHQIETDSFGGREGLSPSQNAQLAAVIANNTQVGCSYSLIYKGGFGYLRDSM